MWPCSLMEQGVKGLPQAVLHRFPALHPYATILNSGLGEPFGDFELLRRAPCSGIGVGLMCQLFTSVACSFLLICTREFIVDGCRELCGCGPYVVWTLTHNSNLQREREDSHAYLAFLGG